MIKKIIHILVLCCIILTIQECSSSKEVKNEKEENIVKEKKISNIEEIERKYIKVNSIKEVEKINFDFDENGRPVKEEKLSAIKYDTNGYIVETDIYNSKSEVENIFTYDYKNNLRTKTTRMTPEGKPDKYYTYRYNKYGNKTRSDRYNMSGVMDKYYLYDYDDSGNLIKETWYDKLGKEEYSIKYEYDNNGRKITAKSYNRDDDLVYKYEYKYDDKGNVIEEIRYNPDGEKVGIIQYIYKYY
jgi:hypothetical protein